ncbi:MULTISPECIES: mycothiol system anti-sigma-R factor [unclassified Gordonia (in: high G+C Gram-positive bacteria)]|uniref:mycothiol system anti-sigma-R factor n=1 Tax=unclassified Gordonia (in: high G+C Gram-positive bacteria) TaxID=2657482 RepID=UPI0020002475|nr:MULTISPECIES: mycothiol system anti-sigma-R factor [unclassified Gordonia (in: high G+C Gram-positive bacteria)]UQE74319.1 mycothiol system anti-sigma-R factor [Gordonia sp. PP30]
MTAGTPDHGERLDCSAVLADIFLLLDNECDLNARARLQEHLEECPSCLEHYAVQQQIKELLRRKCCEAAPEGLRERLRVEIRRTVIVQQTTIRADPSAP